MERPEVVGFKNQSAYVSALFKWWKEQSPVNSIGCLHRRMKTDLAYTSVERLVNGKTTRPHFDLFESAVREMAPGDVTKAVAKFWPHMKRFAERQNIQKPDQVSFLQKAMVRDLYQRITGGEWLSRESIRLEMGSLGLTALEAIIETEQICEDENGFFRVISEDGGLTMGIHVTLDLISHNSSQVRPEDTGDGITSTYYQAFYVEPDEAKEIKCLHDRLSEKLSGKSRAPRGKGVLLTVNTVLREIKADNKAPVA